MNKQKILRYYNEDSQLSLNKQIPNSNKKARLRISKTLKKIYSLNRMITNQLISLHIKIFNIITC